MSRFHPTRNDLPEGARKQVIPLLNAQLADGIDLSLQAKQAHWNVKGREFLPLHELFDKLHAEAAEWNDLIAERAVQLGAIAEGTLQSVSGATRLPTYNVDLADGRDHLQSLVDSLSAYGRTVREAIDLATRAGDAGSADLFTEISRASDKMLWFLEAHLK